ncbi:hypothetical protein FRB94_012384 [Tulasnella sp. JGI-2019a]|nr:hypothetical protein FRB94_012384 [Tulasnella sp. JGI-2019a]
MSAGDGESSETSFPKEDVDWEEKLSRDPLVKADTLQVELGAYVAQLLLTIGALPLDAKIWWYNTEGIDEFITSAATVQARFVTDVDLLYALRAIRHVIHSLSFTHHVTFANLTHRLNSLAPILTRALDSTSDDVSAAACDVLAAFGSPAWGDIHQSTTQPGFLFPPGLLPAALRSLDRFWKDRVSDDDDGLFRWLAASIRSDPSLATTFAQARIISLFVPVFTLPNIQDGRSGLKRTPRNIAYIFLKTYTMTLDVTSFDANQTPEMADATMKTLANYSKSLLLPYYNDTIRRETLTLIAVFVQQAFHLRPAAALLFGLDVVVENSIQQMERSDNKWESWLGRDGTALAAFAKARRGYRRASLARDEKLHYANGASWWKHGGLRRSCEALRSREL